MCPDDDPGILEHVVSVLLVAVPALLFGVQGHSCSCFSSLFDNSLEDMLAMCWRRWRYRRLTAGTIYCAALGPWRGLGLSGLLWYGEANNDLFLRLLNTQSFQPGDFLVLLLMATAGIFPILKGPPALLEPYCQLFGHPLLLQHLIYFKDNHYTVR